MMNRKGRLLQSYHQDSIGPSLEINDAAMEMVVDGAMVNPEIMDGNAPIAGSSAEAEGRSSAAEVIPGPSVSGGRSYSGGSRHSALFSQVLTAEFCTFTTTLGYFYLRSLSYFCDTYQLAPIL